MAKSTIWILTRANPDLAICKQVVCKYKTIQSFIIRNLSPYSGTSDHNYD